MQGLYTGLFHSHLARLRIHSEAVVGTDARYQLKRTLAIRKGTSVPGGLCLE